MLLYLSLALLESLKCSLETFPSVSMSITSLCLIISDNFPHQKTYHTLSCHMFDHALSSLDCLLAKSCGASIMQSTLKAADITTSSCEGLYPQNVCCFHVIFFVCCFTFSISICNRFASQSVTDTWQHEALHPHFHLW